MFDRGRPPSTANNARVMAAVRTLLLKELLLIFICGLYWQNMHELSRVVSNISPSSILLTLFSLSRTGMLSCPALPPIQKMNFSFDVACFDAFWVVVLSTVELRTVHMRVSQHTLHAQVKHVSIFCATLRSTLTESCLLLWRRRSLLVSHAPVRAHPRDYVPVRTRAYPSAAAECCGKLMDRCSQLRYRTQCEQPFYQAGYKLSKIKLQANPVSQQTAILESVRESAPHTRILTGSASVWKVWGGRIQCPSF